MRPLSGKALDPLQDISESHGLRLSSRLLDQLPRACAIAGCVAREKHLGVLILGARDHGASSDSAVDAERRNEVVLGLSPFSEKRR
jgi:hypothetical protein